MKFLFFTFALALSISAQAGDIIFSNQSRLPLPLQYKLNQFVGTECASGLQLVEQSTVEKVVRVEQGVTDTYCWTTLQNPESGALLAIRSAEGSGARDFQVLELLDQTKTCHE